jgi:hypothetical protein
MVDHAGCGLENSFTSATATLHYHIADDGPHCDTRTMDKQKLVIQGRTHEPGLDTSKPHSLGSHATEDGSNVVPSVTFGDLPTEIRLLSTLVFDIYGYIPPTLLYL